MYFLFSFFFCHCLCYKQQDSEDEDTDVNVSVDMDPGSQDSRRFQPYIPEEFANFEVYNATLENQEGSDLKGSSCGGGSGERQVSRSPTTSSCTSGYVSHSASNATLSDLPFSASESSDHISCPHRDPQDHHCCPAGRGYTQTKSVSSGTDAPQSRLSPDVVQDLLSQTQGSLPVSISHCEDKPQPHSCVLSNSQEFTDFKGADDTIGEGDLEPFTERWEQENVESGDTDTRHPSVDCGIINTSEPQESVEQCNQDSGSCPNTTLICTAVRAPLNEPDKIPTPSQVHTLPPASAPPTPHTCVSTVTKSAPAPRAGGEPPIQEPAQGDLPHGSPCPSPNPSSAEPSGDSSGDESTPVAQLPDWMAPGEHVWVGKRRGTVHYVGGVEFAKGIWIGVKLDLAVGKFF